VPEKPFLVVLVTVVFLAMGVLGVLLSLTILAAPVDEEVRLASTASLVISLGYIVVGYGLYKGYRWGWVLAFAITVLNAASNMYYANYGPLLIDAVLIVLLLLTARHYNIPIPVFGRPTAAAPSPARPIASAFVVPKNEKRFVRKKHRY